MGSALTQETGNDLTSVLFPVVNWTSCTSCHQLGQCSGHWLEWLEVLVFLVLHSSFSFKWWRMEDEGD